MSVFTHVRRRIGRAIMGRPAPNAAVFAAATAGRLAADWMAQLLSSDAMLRQAVALLRARSRQLCNDNAYCGGYVLTLLDNVLGERGIVVRPAVLNTQGELWQEVNDTLGEHWERWSADGICSADAEGTFVDQQEVMVRHGAIDGEMIIRHIVGREEDPYRYSIQIIDPDLLDHEWHKPPDENGNQIRLGVETDKYGRRRFYHLYRRHPYDGMAMDRTRVAVPARDIVHAFESLRAGQVRGVPPLTPTILTLKLNDEYIIATLMAARIGASGGGGYFETDPQYYTPPESAPDGTSVNKSLRIDLEPGVGKQLPPGVTFKENNPNFPQDTLGDFEKFMLQSAARSVGLSYATFTGDMGQANYAQGRRGALQERETYKRWQRRTGRVVSRIYREFVKFASMTRLLKLPVLPIDALTRHQYELRGWPWDDPVKDMGATETELALRLTSRTRVCAERGRNFNTVLDEIELEEEEMRRRKLDPTIVRKGSAAPQKEPGEPEDEEEDDEGEDEEKRTQRRLSLTG